VADEHAGRRVKCPVCGALSVVPKPSLPTEVEYEGQEPDFEIVEDRPRDVPRARPAKESSSADDDEPRPRRQRPDRDDDDDDDDDYVPRPRKKKKRRRSSSASMPVGYRDEYRGRGESDLTPVDWFLCIFCPGIGCIVGLVRLISGSGEGGKMMGLSLVFAVIWNVLRFALVAATHGK
jgi:hypothetical protein